jgi:hypothetical protein
MLYVHHVPGRLRVRSRQLKGDPQAAQALCVGLRSIAGVSEAVGNASTGSVTVKYDRRHWTIDMVWKTLHREGIVASAVPAIAEIEKCRFEGAASNGPTATGKLVEAVVSVLVDKLMERSALALIAALI